MDFDKVDPIGVIDGNAVLTRMGDISLCYKLELPEINTISVGRINEIHTAFTQMFLVLPENCLVHRQMSF